MISVACSPSTAPPTHTPLLCPLERHWGNWLKLLKTYFCFVFSFHAWLSCPPIQLLDDDVIRLLCCHLMCCVEIWTMEYRWVLQLLWCLVWITWLIIWNKTIWNYSWHRYYYCLLTWTFIYFMVISFLCCMLYCNFFLLPLPQIFNGLHYHILN